MTTHEAVLSWITASVFAIIAVAIIIVTAHRDSTIAVKYDCALLIGSWHPDFPREVIEACRKKGIKYDSSKTSN